MPGKWDGKSRPTNKQFRENFDAIFKKRKPKTLKNKSNKEKK